MAASGRALRRVRCRPRTSVHEGAGLTAYASTAFLMRYFRGNDRWALNPFAYYCFAAGAGSLAVLLTR